MIHIENLSKRFGTFTALNNLNLAVSAGEVFGFLGPNGAGKTTTMKIMVGLMRPSAGRVCINGIDVGRDPIAARRLIGYIPDHSYLYEKLTAREFLAFVAGLYACAPSEGSARAEQLLTLFDLSAWANELIESYSLGMKQRLAMAAALLHRPTVLIVDEPMVGLDPQGAVLIKALLRKLCQTGKMTVFLSTHLLEVAEDLCDRIAILHQGQVVAQGSTEAIRGQVGATGARLEDLFLQLTGALDVEAAIKVFQP
jgi:ABC-2 type transport system ATP-binding protein